MSYLVLAGRILYALIFVMAGPGHFSADTIAYAASKGVPLASIAVPLSGIIALTGGLSVMAGYRAKWEIGRASLPALAAPAVLRLNLFARGAAWTASVRRLPADVRQGLLAPYNSWHNRLATLKFVQDIPLSPADPSYDLAAEVDHILDRLRGKPMLVCWGEQDFVFDRDYLAEWQRRFPQAEVHCFSDAGHYVLEDVPDRVLNLIEDFLNRHPCPH